MFIKTSNTPNNHVEVHVASGAESQSWRLCWEQRLFDKRRSDAEWPLEWACILCPFDFLSELKGAGTGKSKGVEQTSMPAFRSHPIFYVGMNLSSRVQIFPRMRPIAQLRHPLWALLFYIIGIQIMNAPISAVIASSNIDCPNGPFETDIDKISKKPPLETPTVRSQKEANFAVPIEVSRILEGGISYFQGGLMNQGTTTWYAFDIERRLLIAVLASTGDRSGRIPAVEKLQANQLLRYTDAAGYRRAEFVTVIEATPAQVREFSCLANKLLASPSEQSHRPTPEDAMTKIFSLLHEGKSLDLGGGLIRWEIEGQIERLISQPLQELILQAL